MHYYAAHNDIEHIYPINPSDKARAEFGEKVDEEVASRIGTWCSSNKPLTGFSETRHTRKKDSLPAVAVPPRALSSRTSCVGSCRQDHQDNCGLTIISRMG